MSADDGTQVSECECDSAALIAAAAAEEAAEDEAVEANLAAEDSLDFD